MTGLLPIALNQATKVLKVLLEGGKEYICVIQLHGEVSEAELRRVIGEFQGEVYQRPPLRASVKRALRKRLIYYLEFLELEGRYALLKVGCQAGTYVRKLCSDIGHVLGCGAHMKELRRTRVGPLTEQMGLTTLGDIQDALDAMGEGDQKPLRGLVIPVEEALSIVPRVYIRDSAVDALCHGADLAIPGILRLSKGIEPHTTVAIFTVKGEVVALGRALMSTEQALQSEKGIVVKTERVVMQAGTYPRMWRG